MKCITIEQTVDAWEVEWLLSLAKSDWAKLPAWFKKMHQDNKIMIGGSRISVETKQFNVTADYLDVLFFKEDGYVDVLPKDEFYKIYKDVVCG